MEKAAFAAVEGWWLVEASAPSDVDALRKELEAALGPGWHQSKDKLEALYDTLASSDLVGEELDGATDSDKQTVWLQKVVEVAKPAPDAAAQGPAAAQPEAQPQAAAPAGEEHDASTAPSAPPLSTEEITALASEAGVDPAVLEGFDLSEIEAEDAGAEEEDDEEE